MNGFMRGTLLAVLSGIVLAGCGGNVVQDFNRVGAGETVTAPNDPNLYGSFTGQRSRS